MSNANRPKPRKNNQPRSSTPPVRKGVSGSELLARTGDAADVPVMFRARIKEAHGNLQFSGRVKDATGRERQEDVAKDWVREWLYPWESVRLRKENEELDAKHNMAVQRYRPRELKYELKMPQWGHHVCVWTYQLSWRLMSNSGQDPDLIRPVLGAKGVPYYPGSSMKGAFAKACSEEQRLKYCGNSFENGTGTEANATNPGILRFHGGYPEGTAWIDKESLIDVIHPQQNRQVEEDRITSAKKQISLFQTVLRFGISSTRPDETDWDEVTAIWEKALARGLGGRTSAGYGQIAYRIEGKKKIALTETHEQVLSVYLSGQGITPTLLNRNPEFRPNMFKATLRGQTLRLFGGITDGENAKKATALLWGGISEGSFEESAIVGQVGIRFFSEKLNERQKHVYKFYDKREGKWKEITMYTYHLELGRLEVFRQPVEELINQQKLEDLVSGLVSFTLLLGGFGKSWRRVDHKKFSHKTDFSDYFKDGDKPTIGCHWELGNSSYDFYIDTSNWVNAIPSFLDDLHRKTNDCLIDWKLPRNGYEKNWREAWHSENVQVWGRLASGEKDSLAIAWFHNPYESGKSIKETFAGKIGKIGRIWHRMYPQYIRINGVWQATGKYVELLTIFPRYKKQNDPDQRIANQFVDFLNRGNQFTKLWGN